MTELKTAVDSLCCSLYSVMKCEGTILQHRHQSSVLNRTLDGDGVISLAQISAVTMRAGCRCHRQLRPGGKLRLLQRIIIIREN